MNLSCSSQVKQQDGELTCSSMGHTGGVSLCGLLSKSHKHLAGHLDS